MAHHSLLCNNLSCYAVFIACFQTKLLLVDQSTNETFKISELQNLQKRSTTNSSKQLSFKGLVTTQDSNLEKCKDLVTDLLVSGGTAACAGACAAVFNVAGVIVCTALCSFIETRLGKAGSDQICTQFFG
ncbi:hypothetical protein GLW04_11940 [Halobacillus litoralis]|uniref:Uncharacterized protein n=1 Tax=Halobacillus litoralis TaxID=45668 RepID=A0A845E2V5_9BACI|nr:hypothetical protein [Halobacillus litoralis]MYL20607.1 hypothetical protein [Halobacillus litoralis]